MHLVHLMFLKYRSVNRHPPSLLSGFHGANSPPFQQYYEDTKTAFALLLAFGFPRLRYHSDTAFSLRLSGWQYLPWQPGLFWFGQSLLNRISFGDGRLSCVPVLPQSASDMFLDPGRISPARLYRWFDVALIVLKIKASTLNSFSRLNNIPSTVAVYASCQHLCQLRKTRFRWLTKPCRTGLVTCRVVKRCFNYPYPHLTDLSQRNTHGYFNSSLSGLCHATLITL